jgi:Protein of Unknown function (DUF2784)
MNYYGILADMVTFVHLLYMGYVVFGQLLILIGWPLGWRWIRNPWFRMTHLAMILFVVFEATLDIKCPLTVWEGDLRVAAGQWVDGDWKDISFTGRLLRSIQFAGDNWPDYVNLSFYIAGGIIVTTLVFVPPRFRRPKPAAPQVEAPSAAAGHLPLDGNAHQAFRRADDA